MPFLLLRALSRWTSDVVSLFFLIQPCCPSLPFHHLPDEVQAIATLIEKQAQIVVKPKMVSEEEKQRKAALLAQYADVTDEEDEADEKDDSGATTLNIGSHKSLFRNTNVEDVLNARKLERDSLRDESQRKKEQDKLQREKDKLAKQERKEKEKKRTQRGERKR